MKRVIVTALGVLTVAAMSMAQTSMSNTITAPSGDVCIDCDPYATTLTGVAGASGTTTDLEVVITLDESGSIGSYNFNKEKQAAAYLVEKLRDPNNPSKLLADVGLVRFDHYAQAIVNPPLDDYATVRNAILGLPYNGGGTNFDNAISATRSVFNHDGHSDEEICFFFSDGYSWPDVSSGPTAPMTLAHNEGVLFNTYGITSGASSTDLMKIAGTTDASDPSHYFYAPTFSALQTAIDNSLPSTGSVSLDKVEVYKNGGYLGDAALGVGGNYSYGVDLNYGANDFATKAIATDGSVQWAYSTANGNSCGIPEPSSTGLIAFGLFSLLGLGLRRKK